MVKVDKNKEMADAAEKYAVHESGCTVCSTSGPQMCDAGEKLLFDFYAALREAAAERNKS